MNCGGATLRHRHERHPGDDGQHDEGDEAPDGVPEKQPEGAADHDADEVDEQGLGGAEGKVGLVEEALQVLEHAPASGQLGDGGHGALEERGLQELG